MTDKKNHATWEAIRIGRTEAVWESFHENSKTSIFDRPKDPAEIVAWQDALLPSIAYEGRPSFELPTPLSSFGASFADVVTRRSSTARFERRPMEPATLATILSYAYGVTRRNDTGYPPAFRVVPSGGALYPLELYFYCETVKTLPAGIYHYHPGLHRVELVRAGDMADVLATCLISPQLAYEAELIVFVTAIFEKTTYKYGDRGYRFVLLEAGHVGQNLALVASALELGCLNIGGFFDRRTDRFLGLDGLEQSTVYLAAIGTPS
jgi:SagB-type dehydrogenase family enzyme